MKKLTLDLDALSIETFSTTPAGAREDGTVVAHAKTDQFSCATCYQFTCAADCSNPTVDEWTCWETCGGGCLESRDDTCFCA